MLLVFKFVILILVIAITKMFPLIMVTVSFLLHRNEILNLTLSNDCVKNLNISVIFHQSFLTTDKSFIIINATSPTPLHHKHITHVLLPSFRNAQSPSPASARGSYANGRHFAASGGFDVLWELIATKRRGGSAVASYCKLFAD